MTAMPHQSHPEVRVLHSLRVRGFVDTHLVADASAMEVPEVEEWLVRLESQGDVRYRDGRMSGWMLTTEGRGRGETLLATELEAAGCREGVHSAYQEFLSVNHGFLELCTDWQLRAPTHDPTGEKVVNDHSDPDHDAAVIARLVEVNRVVQPISIELAALLHRFDGYGRRFGDALGRVRAGDHDWFTKPMIESYHTVWFELHENFLATLGIPRASEAQAT